MGICAMDKKANSKPMRAIIQRLIAFGEFEVELFGDDNILNKPVSEWPLCDCLLSWHSDGFPLHKVRPYVGAFRSASEYFALEVLRSLVVSWASLGLHFLHFLHAAQRYNTQAACCSHTWLLLPHAHTVCCCFLAQFSIPMLSYCWPAAQACILQNCNFWLHTAEADMPGHCRPRSMPACASPTW